MATVAAVIASTHHPFYLRAAAAAGEDRPPFADDWVAKIEAFRQARIGIADTPSEMAATLLKMM